MKKLKSLILFGVSLLSLSFLASCQKGDNDRTTDTYQHVYIDKYGVVTTGYEDVHVSDDEVYFKGVHEFNYTRTGKALIRNGKTNYKIVVPDSGGTQIILAQSELTHFFKIATGADLPSISDKNVTYDENAYYISIGQTSLLEQSGLKIDYLGLTDDGCRIITKGNIIYLIGGSDYGSLNAVYDFLHIYFRYEQYSPDIYEIDQNVKNLVVYNFDVTDIPDIPHRAQNYGFLVPGNGDYDQSNFGYRMRCTKGRGYYFMPVYRTIDDYSSPSKTSTNSDTYVPFEEYSGTHPKWFSDASTSKDPQICYTAHGDQDEYNGLLDLVTAKIQNSMKRFLPKDYPNMNVITFTMEDNNNICHCAACKEYENRYGAPSSTLITFVNKVAKRINAWQKLPENEYLYRENFQIIYFAYNDFTDAPITIKSNNGVNEYSPATSEMVLEPNTGVYLAIIDRGDFQFDFFNNPIHNSGVNQNMGIRETIDSWGCLTDSIYLWLYQTNFGLFPYFYDSFSFYSQPMYNYISSAGLKMFFAQGQDTSASGNSGTNFNNLKVYLNCKLSWDSTLDQSVLIERYFKAMYGEAYQEMLSYFGLLRAFYSQMIEQNYDSLVNSRSIYNRYSTSKFVSLSGLNSLIAQIDKAQQVLMESSATAEMKRVYKYNIEAEALFPLYAKLEIYGQLELVYDECFALAQRLMDDIVALRLENMMTRENNGSAISSLPNMYLQ